MLFLPLPDTTVKRPPGLVTSALLAIQAMVLLFGTGSTMVAAVTGSDESCFPAILKEYGIASDGLDPRDLLASLFLHAGPLSGLIAAAFHLLLLGVLGGDLERRIGGIRFLALYILGGAFGALIGSRLSLLEEPDPTLASTSAIAVVMGATLMLVHQFGIRVFFLAIARPGFGVERTAFASQTPAPYAGLPTLPARVVLPICLVLAVIASISLDARSAFLPGAVIGVVAGLLLRDTELAE